MCCFSLAALYSDYLYIYSILHYYKKASLNDQHNYIVWHDVNMHTKLVTENHMFNVLDSILFVKGAN